MASLDWNPAPDQPHRTFQAESIALRIALVAAFALIGAIVLGVV